MFVHVKSKQKLLKNQYLYFFVAIFFGIISGLSDIALFQKLAEIVSSIFTSIFKFLSIPIISLSIIVTLSKFYSNKKNSKIFQRTLIYTIFTTLIAAIISAIIYILVKPTNITSFDNNSVIKQQNTTYIDYLLKSIPSNIISPFLEQNVLSVLLISIAIGISISKISDQKIRNNSTEFFIGLHKIFFIIANWVIIALPIGLFGFVSTAVSQINHSKGLYFIGEYLLVIVGSNLVQGLVVLPMLLMIWEVRPFYAMKMMMPALIAAFFTKSSAGVLPITLKNSEENMRLDPEVSRFVLPLCISINMNGCAAFIFITVLYVMQNEGINITYDTIIIWVLIASIAAIGNAGVPMGCFFLSLSFLSSMDISVSLLGIILPFYSIIDMLETSLNVWSDSCIAIMVDKDVKKSKKLL